MVERRKGPFEGEQCEGDCGKRNEEEQEVWNREGDGCTGEMAFEPQPGDHKPKDYEERA